MIELKRHIYKDKFWELYDSEQWNEAIRVIYSTLAHAIDKSADTLIIRKNDIEWHKDGVVIGKLFGSDAPEPPTPYRVQFETILAHDSIVKDSVFRIKDDFDTVEYKLLL